MALVDTAKIGAKGGKARAANLTATERSASARQAAEARWEGHTAKRPASSRKKTVPKAKKKAAKP